MICCLCCLTSGCIKTSSPTSHTIISPIEQVIRQREERINTHTVVICADTQRPIQYETHSDTISCTPVGHGLLFGDQGGVITAKHVIKDLERTWYIVHQGIYYDVVNIRIHDTYDLAVLHIQEHLIGSNIHVYTGNKHTNIYIQDSINGSPSVMSGDVLKFNDDILLHNVPLVGGLSGSPVYNDQGNPIGINVSYDTTEGGGVSLRFTSRIIDRIGGLDFSQ